MSTTFNLTDHGAAAVGLTQDAAFRTDVSIQNEAIVKSNLAVAQQAKATNLMTYLMADKTMWNVEQHNLVRAYMGMPPLDYDDVHAAAARDQDLAAQRAGEGWN